MVTVNHKHTHVHIDNKIVLELRDNELWLDQLPNLVFTSLVVIKRDAASLYWNYKLGETFAWIYSKTMAVNDFPLIIN